MIRRKVYLENRRVLADAGELVTDIRLVDPISALFFEFRATNGATNNQAVSMADCIKWVQLLDGSDVICSVTGYQLFASAAYKLGNLGYQLITELPSNVQNLNMPLMFGRWFGDQDFSFDPKRFQNPQIRVQWDLAAIRAVGATGFVSGSGTLSIIAEVMQGVKAPSGLMATKQHYSFTTAASGIEYVPLPVDKWIKSILIRSHEAAVGVISGISNLHLGADQDSIVYFDMRKTDFIRNRSLYDKMFGYKHLFHAADGDTIYPILKYDEVLDLQVFSGDNVAGYTNNGIGEGALDLTVGGSSQGSDISIAGFCQGFAPYGAVQYDFGDYDDPNTWLDPTVYKSLRLELTNDNAGAAASVVIEQARMY